MAEYLGSDSTAKKLTITFEGELGERLAAQKRKAFYDRSWADLVRYVVRKGLENLETEEQEE